MDVVPKIFAPKQKLYSYIHISPSFFLNPKTCVPTQRHRHIGWEFLGIETTIFRGYWNGWAWRICFWSSLIGRQVWEQPWDERFQDLTSFFQSKPPKNWDGEKKGGGKGTRCLFLKQPKVRWRFWLKWDISQPDFFSPKGVKIFGQETWSWQPFGEET